MSAGTRKIPPAPPGFSAEKCFAGIQWWQRWEMFEGVFVPGTNCIERLSQLMNLPPDMSGKRVLDVGAWNGCLSFECERRGAREVVALGPERPEWTGFNRLGDALGSTRTKHVLGSIYDLDPRELGYFDIVICSGVLYHLRYPLLGIDNLRRVCTGEVFVETHVCDDHLLMKDEAGLKWAPLKQVASDLAGVPIWQFYRFGEVSGDTSNWFAPNSTAVIQAFESAGFETMLTRAGEWYRAGYHGRIKEGLPEFLAIPCAESVYYDLVARPLFDLKKVKPPFPVRWTLTDRRGIQDFPTKGAGPDLDAILAQQEPLAPPETNAVAEEDENTNGQSVARILKGFGKKLLQSVRRSA
jgi:tRNA (mo5U34)-methyltransferase